MTILCIVGGTIECIYLSTYILLGTVVFQRWLFKCEEVGLEPKV